MHVPRQVYLIEEGENGDRVYILLKGKAVVEKSTETPIHHSGPQSDNKVNSYLQFLYEHLQQVHWKHVPYALQVQQFLTKVMKFK